MADDRLQLMLEAERRGILPAEDAALLGEVRRRGLLDGQSAPAPAPMPPPTGGERFSRGLKDVGQGVAQRAVQFAGALPMPDVSIQELRAYASPEEQKLSDADLLAKYRGVDIADEYAGKVNAERDEYSHRRGPDAGFDWTRLAGNVTAMAPLAVVPGGQTALTRAALGGATGALSGALQYDPSNTVGGVAKNVALGGVTGAVVAPAAGFVTDQISKVLPKIIGRFRGYLAEKGGAANADEITRVIPELKELQPDVRVDLIREAQEQIRRTGKLDPEQMARKANLVAQGVKPTKSMVTRNPADWTKERNLQKLAQSPDDELARVGQELTDVYQANDAALTASLQKLQQNLPRGTQEAHGMKVMQSLDDLAAASQKDVTKIYDAVRAAKGDDLASDAQQLFAALDDLKDSTYSEKLVGSVMNKLRRFGMVDKDGNLTTKSLTVNQAEELRKFVNRLPNDFGKKDVIKAIDADVLSGLGEDAFAGARGAAAQRFAALDNPATQRALNTLGELTQGKTAQNFIKSQIIDGAEQDVATLVATLAKLPPDKAGEAINSLRAGVLQHLEEKAINPSSGKFSGAALSKAIREIGEGKLIRVLGPEQYQQLQNLSRAALDATYEPAYSAVNHSGTAPMLLSLMRRARGVIGIPLPGVNEVAERGLERMSARSQLADVLRARPAGQLPPLPPAAIELARALRAGAGPAAVGALNAARQQSNDPRDKRK